MRPSPESRCPGFQRQSPSRPRPAVYYPTDLPVEQPSGFELAVNFKTAKQLNVTIPYIVMLRATDVIE